jgi:hypothetical protein
MPVYENTVNVRVYQQCLMKNIVVKPILTAQQMSVSRETVHSCACKLITVKSFYHRRERICPQRNRHSLDIELPYLPAMLIQAA